MQHKKALFLLSILVLMVAANILVAGAQDNPVPTVSILPDIQQASAGEEFNVTIQIAGASKIYGASFKLAFDPQSFEVVQQGSGAVTTGAFFADKPGFTLKNTVNAADGVVDYALTLMQPAEPVSGDGVIGTIRFHALKAAPVAMNATEATLVSPEFSEVNGKMVAQRVDQITAQIVQSSASDAQSSVASVADDPLMMFNNPAMNNGLSTAAQPAPAQTQPSQIPLIAAGIFFAVGLVLLTLSVGMYSRMRVRFNMMAMKDIHANQVY